jgi:hypothetical protein
MPKKCTLEIKDEVNIKFHGLDPDTRRKLKEKVEYMLPYARHTPAFKLGRWSGKISFCDIGGRSYFALLDRLLPIILQAGYELDLEDRRQPYNISFDKIKEDSYSHVKWPADHRFAGEPIMFRDYQVEVINEYLSNLQSLQEVSTGAGKCVTYDTLINVSINNKYFKDFLTENEYSTKLDQTAKNCVMINIEIGKFCEIIERYMEITLRDNIEENIKDLECQIESPTGPTIINYIIKKENLVGRMITLSDKRTVKCADKHILLSNGVDVYADILEVGNVIDTNTGPKLIEHISIIDDTSFYDIGIDYPHVYYDSQGILHHNTVITGVLADQASKYGRTITIVPSKDLVMQTEEDFINMGLDVGVYFGDRKDYNKTHTICTWQGLDALDRKHKKYDDSFSVEEFLEGVVCVIVDEAHGIRGDALKKHLTSYFAHCPLRWGMTGTIPKEESEIMSLETSIGPVINQVRAKDLQDKGVLSDLFINILQYKDFNDVFPNYQTELKWLTTNRDRITSIAGHINKQSEQGNTLVLVDRIETGKLLEEILPDCVFISGTVKSKDRKTEYKEINNVDNKVIIATYGVASTGINIPRIFNLYMIEPGKSFIRVIQTIGRGIRKAEDKDFVNIFDVTSTCKYSKRHLTARKKFYREAEYKHKVTKVEY